MRFNVYLLALLCLMHSVTFAQTTFDAVSIKPNRSGSEETNMRGSPGRFSVENTTVMNLLLFAFGARESEFVSAPNWVKQDRFDIEAVTDSAVDLNRATLQPLLQSMFAARFQMTFHRESRERPVSALQVARGGPTLRLHVGDPTPSLSVHSNAGRDSVDALATSMQGLAGVLSRQADRPVVDRTALTGSYDFHLEWDSDLSPTAINPSLFTAIQEQLGLKLDATRAAIEVIVIDRIEKPSDN